MENKISWSVNSEKSLEKIYNFIAQDSEIYANKFISDLILTTEKRLIHQPQIDRKVPEFRSSPLSFLRELIFKGYRIIYNSSDEEKTTIIAVVSGRMDIVKQISS